MPATNKSELLAVTTKEYNKLEQLLERVDDGLAREKDDDDTSIKDIIGHRAHWIDLFLGWYHDGLDGKEVFFPAEGYKWSDLKRYNADLRATQASVTWDDTRSALAEGHEKLIAFIEQRSDHDLYGGPMVGAHNEWTPGRWAEAAGASHSRSASKFIRARLRA